MKQTLITGAAGCIGSNLARYLLDKGEKVVGIDNFITGSRKNITPLLENPQYTFIEHDVVLKLRNSEIKKLKSVDCIYHLACPTGVPNLTKLSEEMILACSLGTRNILDIAKKHNSRVVFTSSSEIYGDPEKEPQKETYTGNVDPTGIRSPYEEGKRFSESLCMMYHRKYNLDVRIVRIFNTYGPYMSFADQRVIPMFIRQATAGKPLTVHGAGTQKRTFCYVDDMVSALDTVMEKGTSGKVYNAGSNKQITIRKLAEIIAEVVGCRLSVVGLPRPAHDHRSRLPDLAHLKRLGWAERVPLTKGLRHTLRWYNTSSG